MLSRVIFPLSTLEIILLRERFLSLMKQIMLFYVGNNYDIYLYSFYIKFFNNYLFRTKINI